MKYPQYTAVTINQVSRAGGMTSEKRDGEYVCGGTNCLSLLCHVATALRQTDTIIGKGVTQKTRAEAFAFLSLDESRKLRLCCLSAMPEC